MQLVSHALHVDRSIIRPQLVHAGRARDAPVDVGRIAVVAHRADFDVVGTVVAVDRELTVAVVALGDVHDRAMPARRRDDVGHRDSIGRAVAVRVDGRVPFDRHRDAGHPGRDRRRRSDLEDVVADIGGLAEQRIDLDRLTGIHAAADVAEISVHVPADVDRQPARATRGYRESRIVLDVVGRVVVGRVGHREAHDRELARRGAGDRDDVESEFLAGNLGRDLVGLLDRAHAARPVAVEAGGVVGEDDSERMPAVRPVDVVVAGAAGCAVRDLAPVAGLRRVRIALVVAGLAVADVLREHDVREIHLAAAVADDEVAVGEADTHVDLVDHLLHVHRAAPGLVDGVAVDRIRVVAGDAVVDVAPVAAVERQVIVAGVAGVVVDDLALEGRRAADGHEVGRQVIGRARVAAIDLEREPVRLGPVVGRTRRIGARARERLRERVLVGAIAVVDERTRGAALVGRLCVGDAAARRRDVGLPFARGARRGRRRQLRQREARLARGQPLDADALLVRQLERHDRRPATARHGNADDFRVDRPGRVDRDRHGTAGPRRSRRSGRTGRAGRALCTRLAVVAFTAGHACGGQRDQRNDRQRRQPHRPQDLQIHR